MKTSEKSYMNYKDLIIQIKSCSCKLFLSNQLQFFSGLKSSAYSVQPLPEFLINEIALNIAKDKERHFKSKIYATLSQ